MKDCVVRTSGIGILLALLLSIPVTSLVAADDLKDRVANDSTYKIYVSPDGSDLWYGNHAEPSRDLTDGPFLSLETARDKARKSKGRKDAEQGITVYLREGEYFLQQTFELKNEDSGTSTAPIIYRAFPGEAVRLIGGRRIRGFAKIEDEAALKRIDAENRDKIQQMDLSAQGVADFGEMTARGFGRPVQPAGLELFYNDKPMTLARWPNEGFVKIGAVPDGQQGGKFTYLEDRPSRWTGAEDVWLHGLWTWDWADSHEKVKSIDPASKTIATEAPHGVYGYTEGKRYYGLNLLEELDRPGEWYLDRKSGILYFWPPEPLEKSTAYVSTLNTLIRMDGVSWVGFDGLTMEVTRANAVDIKDGEHVKISNCVIRNTGNIGVNIDGGSHHEVERCDIYETGDGGVFLNGGDRKTLTLGGHIAAQNKIHEYSRWDRTYRPAVMVGGVGQIVSGNTIYNGPHNAIQLLGNEHRIEYNEIHHVCYETGDVGAFYMGRDWTMRGNVIQYNYFHDIEGPYGAGAMAIYLDDAASGTTIHANLFRKAARAVFIGGGRDNIVTNNIFMDCHPSIHIDARLTNWGKDYKDPKSGWLLLEKLQAMNVKQPPYSEKYPKLVNILEDEPELPKGNVVKNNVSVGGEWLDLTDFDAKIVTFENNYTQGDPGFVDADKLDFTLKENSPLKGTEFEPVPIQESWKK